MLVTGNYPDSPWYNIRIEAATFAFNVGAVTNEIFFDASVSSIELDSCTFQSDISDQARNIGKMAQVLYKPADSNTSLYVHDNTFNCENV